MWRIRIAGGEDRDDILALADRLAEGIAAWRDADRWRSVARSWVEESIGRAATGDGALFVARGEEQLPGGAGRLAGFVSVGSKKHFTGDVDAYVGELVVAPWAEGHGAGRELMAAAETWAAEHGYLRLTLETGASNTRARAFYARLGYLDEDVTLTKLLPGQADPSPGR